MIPAPYQKENKMLRIALVSLLALPLLSACGSGVMSTAQAQTASPSPSPTPSPGPSGEPSGACASPQPLDQDCLDLVNPVEIPLRVLPVSAEGGEITGLDVWVTVSLAAPVESLHACVLCSPGANVGVDLEVAEVAPGEFSQQSVDLLAADGLRLVAVVAHNYGSFPVLCSARVGVVESGGGP